MHERRPGLLELMEAKDSRTSDERARELALEVARTHRAFKGTYYVQTLEMTTGYSLRLTIRNMIGKVKTARRRVS